MSFGPSQQVKQASAALPQLASTAQANSTDELAQAHNLLNVGQGTTATGTPLVNSGTNFFNTLLNGNRANTTALLQPQIDQIRQGNQNTLQGLSTLMPRGGGRSGTLFGASYAPEAQIQNLFNPARANAASALPQIGLTQQQLGLAQQGLGGNLFSVGNQPLQTAIGANSNLAQIGQNQQQITNSLWSGLGQGLFGLATMPFGGAGTLIGGAGKSLL